MVAAGQHIDIQGKKLLRQAGSDAETGSGIFTVCHYQIHSTAADQIGKMAGQQIPPRPSKYIPNKKNVHSVAGLSTTYRSHFPFRIWRIRTWFATKPAPLEFDFGGWAAGELKRNVSRPLDRG